MTGAPVWITRARPGADATAARVAALGFSPIVDPLLAVQPVAADLDLSGVAALAFSSANGVEAFARQSSERNLPVFAVGRATAAAAEGAGFQAVSSADGDVAALGRQIAEAAPGLVLWAGAREPAGDLLADLRRRGVSARGVVVYETVDQAPSPQTLARLDGPLIVLVHSPRAARTLVRLLPGRPHADLRLLCLSPAVAAPLSGLVAPASVAFAPVPDESALLGMLTA